MFFHIAGLRAVGGVRHIAGIHAEGCHHIAGALLLKGCGGRFKFHCKFRGIVPGESRRRRTEINTLVNGKIFLRIDTVFAEDIFKYHLRHTALAPSQNFLSFQIRPLEIRHLFPGHQEIPGPLGKLRKIHHRIRRPFLIGVHRSLGSHEADVRFTGNHRRHHLIGSESVYQVDLQSLFLKITFFNSHILGSVKNGVRHLI